MLDVLVECACEVVGVVTDADSGRNSDYADLSPICRDYGIPLHYTEDINSDSTERWIEDRGPDVVFCMGWSRLIKDRLLKLTPMGVVGYHPAELPKNRGRHPIVWALVLGLKRTASTFYFMDEGADSGDILSQKSLPISPEDTAETLYEKITSTAEVQLRRLVVDLASGNDQRLPQDGTRSNVWRKRTQVDGKIDWRMSALTIQNLVRGLTRPYVGAHFVFRQKEYKVWKSRLMQGTGIENLEPGKVISVSVTGIPRIRCGEGVIELLDVEPRITLAEGEYL